MANDDALRQRASSSVAFNTQEIYYTYSSASTFHRISACICVSEESKRHVAIGFIHVWILMYVYRC